MRSTSDARARESCTQSIDAGIVENLEAALEMFSSLLEGLEGKEQGHKPPEGVK